MVRLEKGLTKLANEFVLVRLTRITGVDLRVFDFDFDLTFAVFFLNADEHVYGRYGGRDAKDAEARLSLTGLEYAARAALAAHRADAPKTQTRDSAIDLIEKYPAARKLKGECIHCHQVNEFRRDVQKTAGTWRHENVWVYPLPENIGLTLENDRGNHVESVVTASPADRAGIKPSDELQTVNGIRIASFADMQYGLHRSPPAGAVEITWLRDGKPLTAKLELAPSWKKTNITWRPSLLDMLPSLPLYGDDLTAAEKKQLGFSADRLAFKQDPKVHSQMKAAGVQPGDIIIGIDGEELNLTMLDFLGHVRRSYLVGDKVTLNLIRSGKRIALPLTLR